MAPGFAAMDICTWKRRRVASVAATFNLTGVCACSGREASASRATAEIRIPSILSTEGSNPGWWGRRFRLPTAQARIKSWQAKAPAPPFFMKFREFPANCAGNSCQSLNARPLDGVWCYRRAMRILLLAGILGSAAVAQSLTDPPPIVQLVRKPGTGGASLKAYANAGAAISVIGMASVTGLPETWLVESHYSFASVEELDQRIVALAPVRAYSDASDPLQDDVLAPTRTMLGQYRANWSYRPDQAIRMFPLARYFQISLYRIRPGMEAEFGDVIRQRGATADVVNLDRPDLVYQVISGAPAGTFVSLSPIVSLRNFDDGINPVPVFARSGEHT